MHQELDSNGLGDASERLLFAGRRLPVVIEPPTSSRDLSSFVRTHGAALSTRLIAHGAILFRGFDLEDAAGFEDIIGAFGDRPLQYTYRSTPRTSVANGIYTATEYPANRDIPLHNENSYQKSWPLKLALCCLKTPTSGGETPIADMREVTAAIGAELLETFRARRVRYVRHYHENFDLPWQEVFQTQDRASVARYCEELDIEHEWIDGATLRTLQVCQGTAVHPITGEETFFNQAHLFHASSLGEEMEQMMKELFGKDRLPRHASFGDGQEIRKADLDKVECAFRDAAVSFPWQRGDVMLLDNMQAAHGRACYSGDRKVLAALLQGYSLSE